MGVNNETQKGPLAPAEDEEADSDYEQDDEKADSEQDDEEGDSGLDVSELPVH